MIINEIYVVANSISIVSLELFAGDAGDTLSWSEKAKVILSKIRMYGTMPTCSIAGKVVDGMTNKPLKEAILLLKDFPWWSTKTDASGNFCIPNILPGFFTVSAMHLNYHNEYVLKVRLCPDSYSSVNFFLPPLGIPEAPLDRIWDGTITEGSCR